MVSALTELRFDLIEEGVELEEFHATEDRQATRDRVFATISDHLSSLRVDSIVVRKRKTHPKVQQTERFYPEMLGHLLSYMIHEESLGNSSEVIVVTDVLPLKNKRKAIEQAVKGTLKRMLPPNVKYRVMHHDSRSCSALQVADYLNWAILRKWKDRDRRSHKIIEPAIKSEFDIFRYGYKTGTDREMRPPRLPLRESPLGSYHRGGTFTLWSYLSDDHSRTGNGNITSAVHEIKPN